jgi:transketolase C-terminal domain/subunit
MKTQIQIERKIKRLVSDIVVLNSDIEKYPKDETFTSSVFSFIMGIKKEIEIISWATGISYKPYLPKKIQYYFK